MLHVHDYITIERFILAGNKEVVRRKTGGSNANTTSAHYVFDAAPVSPPLSMKMRTFPASSGALPSLLAGSFLST